MDHAAKQNRSKKAKSVKLFGRYRVPSSTEDDLIHSFLSAIDHPRALTVWLLYVNREHSQLVDLECNPASFNDAYSFRDALTATSFLAKSNFLRLSLKTKEVALTKFFEAEEQCRRTNRRLSSSCPWENTHSDGEWLLNATIRKVHDVLGDFSPEEVADGGRWGPGSTYHLRGLNLSASNKFRNKSGITRDLIPLIAPCFYAAYPGWCSHTVDLYGVEPFEVAVGNRLLTVPKNAKTDRVIAVEPAINLWFQLAGGLMIRKRLRRFGVDLKDQQRNQQLALSGSKTGKLATVDFSMASDTVSSKLVEMLLPRDWYTLFNALRSKYTLHEGRPIELEKFSSMGNGFTFELESLIFYAIACAVCSFLGLPQGEISVFGDDVILPNEAFNLFALFCKDLGFSVNTEKSFNTTPFRESCGSYYWSGIDCKPIFHKEKCHNVESLYKLANNVRLLAHRRNTNVSCDVQYRDCWIRVVSCIPEALRFGVPKQLGNAGLIVNFDEACPPKARDQIEGFMPLCVVSSPGSQYSDDYPLLLERLVGRSELSYGNRSFLRGVTRHTIKRVLVNKWYDLGQWL